MPEIATILAKAVEIEGTIPFARFMELALYCPNFGYYERAGLSPGRKGDFFTSVSVGPTFGRLLATVFADWLESIPDGPVHLVEAGAHEGQLALDILSWFEDNNCRSWPRLEYWLIEPSSRRRAWQAERLERFRKRLRWVDSPDALGSASVRGIIFSNELLDAFPVTRLRWCAERAGWDEMRVRRGQASFEWTRAAIGADRAAALLQDACMDVPPELERVLPDGFTLDLTPGARNWWGTAAASLGKGTLLTLDYGLMAEEFLSPSRANGTLRAYHRHRPALDVLAFPGEQDLTSHVNFSQLIRAGEDAGLQSEPLQTQAQFLSSIIRRRWDNRGAASITPQRRSRPKRRGRCRR
jgi:SAM-dependent MidA family methyltransferase